MNDIFEYFKLLFRKTNYSIYMIGSFSRDYLLKVDIKDYDLVTDAPPKIAYNILKVNKDLIINDKYIDLGVIKVKYLNLNIDIVTLREESDYLDFRHPKNIKFVKDINLDYKRRDFTINAIYIDKNYKIIDPSNGYKDLLDKRLRFIKDPLISIKEDPLRILRAYRFIKEYDLYIDPLDLKTLKDNEHLLNNLNKEKIKEEERKYDKMIKRKEEYEK